MRSSSARYRVGSLDHTMIFWRLGGEMSEFYLSGYVVWYQLVDSVGRKVQLNTTSRFVQ